MCIWPFTTRLDMQEMTIADENLSDYMCRHISQIEANISDLE